MQPIVTTRISIVKLNCDCRKRCHYASCVFSVSTLLSSSNHANLKRFKISKLITRAKSLYSINCIGMANTISS